MLYEKFVSPARVYIQNTEQDHLLGNGIFNPSMHIPTGLFQILFSICSKISKLQKKKPSATGTSPTALELHK